MSRSLGASTIIELENSNGKQGSKRSPYIYGLATYMADDRTKQNTWILNPGYFRFGGNTAERFNFKVNAWNTGKDWYFSNFSFRKPNMINVFLSENYANGVPSSVTIPAMGWVAKDGKSGSFPESIYGRQKDARNGMGNGIDGSGNMIQSDPKRANIPIDQTWVSEYVRYLKPLFGNHPHHYIIGNEPMLWHETHRDVHPDRATYEEVLAKYLAAAKTVRSEDPQAVIIGPALWGWLPMQQSAFDERGPWSNYTKFSDRDKHGGKPFLSWFLQRVVQEEKKLGVKLIDAVDVHYYPDGEVRSGNPASDANRRARIAATRSLWDRTYLDNSWINEKIYLLPRLKEMATEARSDLKVAIGEYNFGAEDDMSGAVVLAEVLGIFNQEDIWSANYWTIPPQDSPAAFAFRLFRNYDGVGGAFGDEWVPNSIGIQKDKSVFVAKNSAKKAITIVLINKSIYDAQHFTISEKGIASKSKGVRLFRYSIAHPKGIVETKLSDKRPIAVNTPPLSVALVEIKY